MKIWKLLFGIAMIGVTAAPLWAATQPAMDWDPAFFYENGLTGATPFNSDPGMELNIVGIISAFGPPFEDLNPGDPGREYTFFCQGLISQGTVSNGPPSTTVYTTHYAGGTIEVYEDLSPEASFDSLPPNPGVPSDFQDGTLILSGNFTSLYTVSNNFTQFQTGNAEGGIDWTGGTLLERTRPGGVPCPGLFTGGLTWRPSIMIPGYLFRHDGKIDLNCPSSASTSTWGKLKALYR